MHLMLLSTASSQLVWQCRQVHALLYCMGADFHHAAVQGLATATLSIKCRLDSR